MSCIASVFAKSVSPDSHRRTRCFAVHVATKWTSLGRIGSRAGYHSAF